MSVNNLIQEVEQQDAQEQRKRDAQTQSKLQWVTSALQKFLNDYDLWDTFGEYCQEPEWFETNEHGLRAARWKCSLREEFYPMTICIKWSKHHQYSFILSAEHSHFSKTLHTNINLSVPEDTAHIRYTLGKFFQSVNSAADDVARKIRKNKIIDLRYILRTPYAEDASPDKAKAAYNELMALEDPDEEWAGLYEQWLDSWHTIQEERKALAIHKKNEERFSLAYRLYLKHQDHVNDANRRTIAKIQSFLSENTFELYELCHGTVACEDGEPFPLLDTEMVTTDEPNEKGYYTVVTAFGHLYPMRFFTPITLSGPKELRPGMANRYSRRLEVGIHRLYANPLLPTEEYDRIIDQAAENLFMDVEPPSAAEFYLHDNDAGNLAQDIRYRWLEENGR